MNKTAIRARVQRLERYSRLYGMNKPAPAVDAGTVTARFLDGVLSATVRDGDGLRVHIERALTLSRDTDGSWLVYSGEHAASVTVLDPLACEAFDAVSELIANPNAAGCVTIREPDDDAA